MMSLTVHRTFGAFLVAAVAANTNWAANNSRAKTDTSKAPAASSARPGAARGAASARGVLPDPVLLDGSTHPAEKKSEYGMIGEFELPGDENARNGKVGGQPGSPGGQQAAATPGGGGLPLPAASSGGGQGGGAPNVPPPPQGGGGGGKEGQNPGQSAGAPGDAQAGGIQVAELKGEGGQDAGGGTGEKPPPVAIGDAAMRIPSNANAPGVVGGQQQIAGQNTQHHEKGTGSGGKGPQGVQGTNRVEKGRTIPAGL